MSQVKYCIIGKLCWPFGGGGKRWQIFLLNISPPPSHTHTMMKIKWLIPIGKGGNIWNCFLLFFAFIYNLWAPSLVYSMDINIDWQKFVVLMKLPFEGVILTESQSLSTNSIFVQKSTVCYSSKFKFVWYVVSVLILREQYYVEWNKILI